MGTQIYYLLDPNSPWGRMHMNRSATFHVHHCGMSHLLRKRERKKLELTSFDALISQVVRSTP